MTRLNKMSEAYESDVWTALPDEYSRRDIEKAYEAGFTAAKRLAAKALLDAAVNGNKNSPDLSISSLLSLGEDEA